MAFTFKDATRLFQVKPGRKFSLKHHDPSWAGDGEFKDLRKGALKQRAVAVPAEEHLGAGGGTGTALRHDMLLGADRAAGDGRGRQGRHDQARHVRA